jgi:hypothetical protein
MASVTTKLLLGWMAEGEAMQWLLREHRGNPPFTPESAKRLWDEYRAKVTALPPRDCAPPPILLDRTQQEEYAEHRFCQKYRKNPNILRVLKLGDPGRLVVYQLMILVSQSERYLADMKDPKRRVRTCLGRGLNHDGIIPKARREGDCLIKSVPHGEFFIKGGSVRLDDFDVEEGHRHIAVKEFDRRMLLWAGYHRSHVSLYRRNPEEAVLPLFAVLESDTTDGFFSVNSREAFKRDMVRGTSPPLLADFFDDSLCITLPLRKCRVEMQVNTRTGACDRLWPDAGP